MDISGKAEDALALCGRQASSSLLAAQRALEDFRHRCQRRSEASARLAQEASEAAAAAAEAPREALVAVAERTAPGAEALERRFAWEQRAVKAVKQRQRTQRRAGDMG